jgi:DNA-binding response OmpR family regulator
MTDSLRILAIDADRGRQAAIAPAANARGVTYRFLPDAKKAAGGIKQLKPDVLMIFGDVHADFTSEVLDSLGTDVAFAKLPIVLVTAELADQHFVANLRTRVVALFPLPFALQAHLSALSRLLEELPLRSGAVSGYGDSTVLNRLVEHIRRTRRSGTLTFNGRTSKEGVANFAHGKLESGKFGAKTGMEALIALVAQHQAHWMFTEVAGVHGEGAGVIIEVGESSTGEEEVAVLVGEPVDATTVEYEMPVSAAPPPRPSPMLPPPPPPEAFASGIMPAIPVRPPVIPPMISAVSATAPVASNGVRLLLVDDDEALVRMFSTLFTKRGFQVSAARDGAEGFEVALRSELDVVVADLNMPNMDGWGMLRLLRDDFRTRELPLAFLSCHDDYRDSLKALDAGAQAYFSKGTRLDSLVGQVKKLLEPRETALAQLKARKDFSLSVSTVGPQWLLRELALAKFTGRLDAKDGWASYQLFMEDGALNHAAAQAGRYSAEGERALNAFVASRASEGKATFGPFPAPASLNLPTEVLLERSCGTLNENERRLKEGLLIAANHIEVNTDLYNVYSQVGPKQYLEVARLICEEKAPPRDVLTRLDISPVEVEETLKDLIRRNVVTLRK